MAFHLYARGSARGTYLQNSKFFPTDLRTDVRWGFFGIWHISILTTTPCTIEYTVDGGTTWFPLSATPIPANEERIFQVNADDKELFNLRSTDVANCDVYRALVSIAPQDVMRPRSDLDVNIPTPLPVDICPVNCPIDVNVLNPIVIPNPLPVSITGQPILVDICPVSCEIDVDINSISFGDIPVINGATPLDVVITGQPISVDVVSFLPDPLPVDICPVSCDLPVVNGSVSPLIVQLPVGTPNGATILNLTNVAILANTDISGVDLSPTGTVAGQSVIFRIEWSASAVGVLNMTLDGTNFVEFNNGANLRAESIHLFDVVVDHADLFNLQFNKPATIRFLRVIQVI